MRLKKVCLELLAEAGARWDQFHVRWQCTDGDGKSFVRYKKPST